MPFPLSIITASTWCVLVQNWSVNVLSRIGSLCCFWWQGRSKCKEAVLFVWEKQRASDCRYNLKAVLFSSDKCYATWTVLTRVFILDIPGPRLNFMHFGVHTVVVSAIVSEPRCCIPSKDEGGVIVVDLFEKNVSWSSLVLRSFYHYFFYPLDYVQLARQITTVASDQDVEISVHAVSCTEYHSIWWVEWRASSLHDDYPVVVSSTRGSLNHLTRTPHFNSEDFDIGGYPKIKLFPANSNTSINVNYWEAHPFEILHGTSHQVH